MLNRLYLWVASLFTPSPKETRLVLIRKTIQPMGPLSEMYIDKQFVSFAYDTLPKGEQIVPSNSVTYTIGHNAVGRNTITVPKDAWDILKDLIRPKKHFNVEVLERWALKV